MDDSLDGVFADYDEEVADICKDELLDELKDAFKQSQTELKETDVTCTKQACELKLDAKYHLICERVINWVPFYFSMYDNLGHNKHAFDVISKDLSVEIKQNLLKLAKQATKDYKIGNFFVKGYIFYYTIYNEQNEYEEIANNLKRHKLNVLVYGKSILIGNPDDEYWDYKLFRDQNNIWHLKTDDDFPPDYYDEDGGLIGDFFDDFTSVKELDYRIRVYKAVQPYLLENKN